MHNLIHIIETFYPLLNTLGLIALGLYCKHLFLKDFPGRSTIDALRIEVSDLSGLQADLIERFNRFQKKEGMRAARAEKEVAADVLEQARTIAAQEPSQEGRSEKADLYRKMRH